jgi:DNA-binding GntR family transcriptional regulator
MVTIGAGRADDPRQWVQAAYLLLDTIEDGGLDALGKLPAQAEIAAEMGVHRTTVSHAYRELAEMGIVYRVPGLGYFALPEAASERRPAGGRSRDTAGRRERPHCHDQRPKGDGHSREVVPPGHVRVVSRTMRPSR